MKEISINGTARVAGGKKAAKALRAEGMIPCVIYGEQKNEQGLPVAFDFAVSERELNKLIYTPNIYLVNLTIDGKTCKAVVKDAQFHPVRDNVLHVDFYEVSENKPIVMAVPVQTEGLAEGVRAGGRLALMLRKLKVRATYANIPEKLIVKVEHLGLGKSVKAGDLSFDGLEIVTPKEVIVCTIKMTRAAAAAAAAAKKEG
ncbi:MAG: 50S ribosomal protein L25/general stress protein Ctc [Alloprevotella sp.]|nr:50S ribosomal protein L25/general stress protein Ctc [Bacteroidales bacterium]MDY3944246.1 50S ribosomal protein L25/general stress protein Ctc [Alloprevotella sp.]